jgi:8-oxo-dGTP pyrophosphatase MutT (NUDIX family)
MDTPIVSLTDLDLRFEPTPWRFAEERRAEIDAHFERQRVEKPELWNGRLLLLRHWSIEGSVFRGDCFETDFASMLAWRDFGYPDMTVFNCFGMAALRAADGAYLLGEMSAGTANGGSIYFPSGAPDLTDLREGVLDLAGNVMRELAEETGLTADDVEIDGGWTCICHGQRIAMMRGMQAHANADALRARMLDHVARDLHQELADIHVVRGPRDINPQRMPPWITAYFDHVWDPSVRPSEA